MTSETGNSSSADDAYKGLDADLPLTRRIRHYRVNRRWEENVTRVLGEEFEGKWSSIYEMIFSLKTAEPRRYKYREWTQEETELAGRLICWGLTIGAIGKIVGRTETAACKYVRRNQDIVDVSKRDEEHVLNCQAEEEEEEEKEKEKGKEEEA